MGGGGASIKIEAKLHWHSCLPRNSTHLKWPGIVIANVRMDYAIMYEKLRSIRRMFVCTLGIHRLLIRIYIQFVDWEEKSGLAVRLRSLI